MDTKLSIALLALLTIVVFIVNIDCCALRLDDWCQLEMFGTLTQTGVCHALKYIFTNEWVHGASRTNFLSFHLKYALYLIWGYNYIPYYVVIFMLHFSIAVLLFMLLKPLDRRIAFSSAVFALLLPTAQQVLFWNNNIFFVVPVFFYLLYVHAYLHPRRNRIADFLCLSTLLIVVQFSGEQLLLVLYLTPAVIALITYFRSRSSLRSALPRILVPPLICAVFLILYVKFGCAKESHIAGGYKDLHLRFDCRAYLSVACNSLRMIVMHLNVKSWLYGGFSIAPSPRTLVLSACSALVLFLGIAAFYSRGNEKGGPLCRRERHGRLILVLLSVLFIFSGLFPMAVAVVSGIRRVEPRYFYILNISLSILLSVVISCLARRSTFMYGALVLLISIYLSFLTCYALRENWRYVKEYDKKVWAATTGEIQKGHDHILFIHAGKWWCAAVSDFVQRYGISGYLRAHGYTDVSFDIDTLNESNRHKKIVVIQVECPNNHAFLDPQITIFPSYESYLSSREIKRP